MRMPFAILVLFAAVSCNAPPSQPQTSNVVNATEVAEPVPSGNNANETAAATQAKIHQVTRPTPEDVVRQFGDLLEQKDVAKAFGLVDAQAMRVTEKQFEKQFTGYKTIKSAVGTIGRTEGAAGSLYSTVQLTLSGNKKDGGSYVMTGPVTLRRVNDVPGSTEDERRWHIVKMELAANPKAAESLLKNQSGRVQ
jgi:hypothetical protein